MGLLTVTGIDWSEARVQPWLIVGKVQHVEVQHPKGVVRVVTGECRGELDNSAMRASHSRNKGVPPLAADDAVPGAFQYLQGNFLSLTELSTPSAEARHPRGAGLLDSVACRKITVLATGPDTARHSQQRRVVAVCHS